MSTLHALARVVHQLQVTHIPKAKRCRFSWGVSQLSLREFVSVNAAGRLCSSNRWTGESKIRRTVTDTRLADRLQQLLVAESLAGRSGSWYCNLDHSQFGPFCIAVLAVSVRKGRAIPVWAQVNVSEAALMAPLLAALEGLLATLQLVLVMDRWFAADRLFTLITTHQAYFIARTKSDRRVVTPFIARTKSDRRVVTPWGQYWQQTPVGEVSPIEVGVTYRKHELWLIRSTLKPGMKDPEP